MITTKKFYVSTLFFTLSLVSLLVTVIMGIFTAFYYTEIGYIMFKSTGITFRELRPIHTTFSIGWLFLGSVGVVYSYLMSRVKDEDAERLSFFSRIHFAMWFICGIFIIISLFYGKFSGREYMEFHPFISLFLLLGWLFFLFCFFKIHNIFSLPQQPVYVYFWFCGILYFIYSFVENHVWLLPIIWNLPVVDLQIQWKSLGSLVASFNMLIYGSFAYLSVLLGDNKYVYSRTAFILFGIGLLNSLTNYTHHTYHLPQVAFVKWLGFIVSMIEIFLFIKVINDVLGIFKQRDLLIITLKDNIIYYLINSIKWWNVVNLLISIIISVPFLNSIIHGTQVVFAHVMGSMIGIDSMVLFAVLAFLIFDNKSVYLKFLVPLIAILNISLFVFVTFFCFIGIKSGFSIYLGQSIGVLNTSVILPITLSILGVFLFFSMVGIALIYIINIVKKFYM